MTKVPTKIFVCVAVSVSCNHLWGLRKGFLGLASTSLWTRICCGGKLKHYNSVNTAPYMSYFTHPCSYGLLHWHLRKSYYFSIEFLPLFMFYTLPKFCLLYVLPIAFLYYVHCTDIFHRCNLYTFQPRCQWNTHTTPPPPPILIFLDMIL